MLTATKTHEKNGQASEPGPLERATLAERRLIERMHEQAERIDAMLANPEIDLAKKRLSDAYARLRDRARAASSYCEFTADLCSAAMTAAAAGLSDDATRAGEWDASPVRPLSADEAEAIASAPWNVPPDEEEQEDDYDPDTCQRDDAPAEAPPPEQPAPDVPPDPYEEIANRAVEPDVVVDSLNNAYRQTVAEDAARDTRREPQPPPPPPPVRKKRRGGRR